MLGNQWYDEEIARQRRADLMRQAANERTVRQPAERRTPLMVSLRRSVGNRLIGVGERLRSQQPSFRNAHEW